MSVGATRLTISPAPGRRWALWPAWGLALAALALSCGALALATLNHGSKSFFAPDLESAFLFPIVGAVIISRRAPATIGWTLCGGGFFEAISIFAAQYVAYGARTQAETWPLTSVMAWLNIIAWAPGFVLLLVYFPSLFPDGHFLSTRWQWVGWIAIVGALLWVAPVTWDIVGAILSGMGPQQLFTLLSAPRPPASLRAILALAYPVMGIGVLLASVSLAFRWSRALAVQRQQLKWFVYASIIVAISTGFDIFQSVFLNSHSANFDLVGSVLEGAAIPLFVVAIGIAILRHRLWDIDVVINRTLVYGWLSATLAGIYFATVLAAQTLLNTLVPGQSVRQSPIVIVATTLLVASLFSPLRRRFQSAVDRRFYRRNYDVAKTLAAYSASLRSEVQLDELRAHLLDVVDETMQPTSISLWLQTSSSARMTAR